MDPGGPPGVDSGRPLYPLCVRSSILGFLDAKNFRVFSKMGVINALAVFYRRSFGLYVVCCVVSF